MQPPLGSLVHPGDCTCCGISWPDHQLELDRQEVLLRLGTAHEGVCKQCGQKRIVFRYVREQQPWEQDEPPVMWFCARDWSIARESEETTGFLDFNDLFDRGSDEQLEAGLRGTR
ncbi:hypothetical protein ACIOKD_14430 [Streptomyces sp. NPDC087844]|uniref:hypothetical protein n=1 Tax=Streptomyces sp. NPDC087844 TaxID=3365805 RepID=UPI0037F55BF5